MNVRWVCLAASAVVCLGGLGQANAASLEGHTLRATTWSVWPHGSIPIFAQAEFVVGPDVEAIDFDGYLVLDIDVSDTTMRITASIDREANRDPQYLTFDDVDGTIPRFAEVTVNPATTWDEFDPGRVYFYPNHFGVWVSRLSTVAGQQISLDIVTMLPEPAGWLLAALAMSGVAATANRGRCRAPHVR
jgi:hypothetical protein